MRGRDWCGAISGCGDGVFRVCVGEFAREDEPAVGSLHGGRDGELLDRSDMRRAVLGDDHGSVVEEADGLSGLLAGAEEFDGDGVARDEGGAHGACEVVDVEDADALDSRDAGQAGVSGDDEGGQESCEFDEFLIHAGSGDLGVVDGDVEAGGSLES